MLSKMIGFFLIPLYTHYLSPKDYGTLELISLTADLLAILIGAQISTAVFKFYHQAKEDDDRKNIISTAIIGLATISGTSFLILGYNAGFISNLIFGHEKNTLLLQLMFCSYFFVLLEEVPLAYLRILDKSRVYVLITFAQFISMICLNIFFIAFMKYGVLGMLLSTLITFSIICITLLIKTLTFTGIKLIFSVFLDMLRYSTPLIPATLSMFVINFSDRFFLNHYESLAQVGIYSLAYKFGMILTAMIVQPFSLIWQSKMFQFYEDENRSALYNSIFLMFLFVMCSGYLLISGYVGEALKIMVSDKYYEAAIYVPIICAAYLLNGINLIFNAPLYAEKKTKIIGKINLLAALLNVILNITLIPVYGIMGAAIATLLSYLFIVSYTVFESTKISNIEWDWKRYIKVILITIFTIMVIEQIKIENILLAIALKSTVLFFALFILYLSRYFTQSQTEFIRRKLFRVKDEY